MNCKICLDNIDHDKIVIINCGHKICNNCFENLIQKKCPFCRYIINDNNNDIYQNEINNENNNNLLQNEIFNEYNNNSLDINDNNMINNNIIPLSEINYQDFDSNDLYYYYKFYINKKINKTKTKLLNLEKNNYFNYKSNKIIEIYQKRYK